MAGLTDDEVAKVRALLEAQDAGGGYQKVEGVEWVPVYDKAGVEGQISTWRRVGGWAAGAVALLAALMAVLPVGDGHELGILAVAGAVAAGLLLLGAGVGLMAGEALRAEKVVARVPDADVRVRALSDDATVSGSFLEGALTSLGEGLKGLTAARALVFAGAFLLAVAAVAGGVAGTGAAGDGSGGGPTPTPSPSVTTEL
ncbi:hypothetical protein GXB85_04030 [Cellulomonas sp. APG4]|uniref:hypothetical protein n=1 Tax=Cellulomonas sp. APG4 TaxID=1538656 RepID=UPI00137ABEFB|nr:hypothetical protein [Cellulomonas sp. APG4]NCT90124.1 hypothetical protein [Cellulomonas sp. APG4]